MIREWRCLPKGPCRLCPGVCVARSSVQRQRRRMKHCRWRNVFFFLHGYLLMFILFSALLKLPFSSDRSLEKSNNKKEFVQNSKIHVDLNNRFSCIEQLMSNVLANADTHGLPVLKSEDAETLLPPETLESEFTPAESSKVPELSAPIEAKETLVVTSMTPVMEETDHPEPGVPWQFTARCFAMGYPCRVGRVAFILGGWNLQSLTPICSITRDSSSLRQCLPTKPCCRVSCNLHSNSWKNCKDSTWRCYQAERSDA